MACRNVRAAKAGDTLTAAASKRQRTWEELKDLDPFTIAADDMFTGEGPSPAWRKFGDHRDHEGGGGFNAPIYKAICVYFNSKGAAAPADEIRAFIREAVDTAEKDSAQSRHKYATDSYIFEQIEKGRAWKVKRDEAEQARALRKWRGLMRC